MVNKYLLKTESGQGLNLGGTPLNIGCDLLVAPFTETDILFSII